MTEQEELIYSLRGSLFEAAVNYGVLKGIMDETKNGEDIFLQYMDKYAGNAAGNAGLPVFRYQKYAERYIRLTGDTSVTESELVRMMEAADLEGYDMFRSYIIGLENEYCRASTQRTVYDRRGKGRDCEPKYEVVYAQLGMYHLFDENNSEYNVARQVDLYEAMMSKHFDGVHASRYDASCWKETGEFLNADTLVFLRRKHRYYLFVSDESGYVGDTALHVHDGKSLRDALAATAGGFYGQSYFRNVATKGDGDYNETEIRSAISMSTDKGAAKANQAASYAASFLEHLTKNGITEKKEPGKEPLLVTETEDGKMKHIIHVSAIGLTNREHACINMKNPVQEDLNKYRDWYKEHAKNADLDTNLKQKHKNLYREFTKQFPNSAAKLKKGADENGWYTVEAIYQGHNADDGTMPQDGEYVITTHQYRREHGEYIAAAMNDPDIYKLFLTGAAGIGKTTSTLNTMMVLDRLFAIYISPRTALNTGFAEDFLNRVGAPVITTHSNLPDNTLIVTGTKEDFELLKTILEPDFCVITDDRESILQHKKSGGFKQADSRNSVYHNGQQEQGILVRLGKSIQRITAYAYKNKTLSRIGISLSTQAIGSVWDTNRESAIEILFGLKNNPAGDCAISQFAETYRNAFVIIDEVSGDDTGIRSYRDIEKNMKKIKTTAKRNDIGLNLKLIIMDASIADKKSAERYTTGNTNAYISVQKPDEKEEHSDTPYGIQAYKDGENIQYINGNTFPAKSVHIRVKFATDPVQKNGLREKILSDVQDFCRNRRDIMTESGIRKEQCIVYLQDKKELDKMQQTLQNADAKTPISCEIMYGNSSATEKASVKEKMNAEDGPSVLLMTSSGSRGLSFKYVTTIFLAVPGFDIESNLMEILQAIYRGRGDPKVDTEQEKTLVFYHNIAKSGKPPKDVSEEEKKRLEKRHEWMRNIDIFTISMLINDCFRSRVYGKGISGYKIIPFGRQSRKSVQSDVFHQISKAIETVGREFAAHKDSQMYQYYDRAKIGGIEFSIKNSMTHKMLLNQVSKANAALATGDLIRYRAEQNMIPLYTLVEGCVVIRENEVTEDAKYNSNNQSRLNKEAAMKELDKKTENVLIAGKRIIEYVEEQKNLQDIHQMQSQENGAHYFAYPVEAFGLDISPDEYETEEDEANILQLLYTLMNSKAKITSALPAACNYRRGEIPFLCFRSMDFDRRMTSRFLNDELVMSTDTNLLGLIFAGQT